MNEYTNQSSHLSNVICRWVGVVQEPLEERPWGSVSTFASVGELSVLRFLHQVLLWFPLDGCWLGGGVTCTKYIGVISVQAECIKSFNNCVFFFLNPLHAKFFRWSINIYVTFYVIPPHYRLAYPRPGPNHKIHDLKPYNFAPNHTIFWSNHTISFQTIQMYF